MLDTKANTVPEHRLTVAEILGLLVADGIVPKTDADALIAECRLKRLVAHPLTIIADQKWKSLQAPFRPLTLDIIAEWFAGKLGLEYYHIDPLKIDFTAVTDVMSSAYATRFGILPVQVTSLEVVFATIEPFLRDWENEIKPIIKKNIRRVIANPVDVARYLIEFYNLARSVKKASQQGGQSAGLSSFEQLVELGRSNRQFDANDQHIVNIVDWLWQYAFDQRASDIHIEPRREIGIVRFRIDGVLHQVYQIPMSVMAAMVSRIKILGRMDLVEKRRPQDGRIKTRTADGQEAEMRLSTLPTAFGEKLVMRIFDPEVLVRNFTDLGFSEEDQARWKSMSESPNGVILVTGPTGSGKTTTLYSTLKQLATPAVNVCTIEDPIEMVEPAFNQLQVQNAIDLDFAQGVRALMRQDPDIIMVGEIRDLETAEVTIQAALTGHLVLSTLHTNDSPAAVTRMLDLGVPSYLISATVLGIMAQRLVRLLCPLCKKSNPASAEDEAMWDRLVAPWKANRPSHFHQPGGCLECRMTGYRGRVGIYEILMLTPDMKQAITDNADVAKIRDLAYREGMKPLRISGAMKVAAGITTLAEVFKVAPPSERA
ncbi:GspE/PulE family protein [Propionivibrio sp.]|uniref:GspE/PulE family protein n=1 Tax=Propionivibrio sp. TaxID=2212460 RepID=UPI0025F92240|nr:GspE/PulE family protein [Propionivibrio sp.]MBK7355885.1 type II/IV secretion system protein [Propionivibrio sp.]MBK8400454.1 type II/IV secretion system protein [Propionivibrio sp.]MBK8746043.1 type II/IV secretion system protein [Propionivibrio sp.]MBK8895292.1 type II/IV secretion system protein [Propionivibrio sp.]MBL0206812.1 type II/IV secretion system protein [Propionivibrio sp.]